MRYQSLNRSFASSEIGGTLNTGASVMAFHFDYHADSGIAGWNVQRFAVGGGITALPQRSSPEAHRITIGGISAVGANTPQ